MCCSKLILFVSNALLFVFGIFVIASASVTISKGNEYGSLLVEGTFTLPIIILILGIFITILGFLGCFGAVKESKCMLYTYSAIVLVLFFAEISVAILIIAHPKLSKDFLTTSLDSQFKNYYTDPATAKSIDKMQQNLKCCGVESPYYWKKNGMVVPMSCCPIVAIPTLGKTTTTKAPSTINLCNAGTAYRQGCVAAVITEFQSITLLLGAVGIALGLFMIFSMSTACGLAKRNNYK